MRFFFSIFAAFYALTSSALTVTVVTNLTSTAEFILPSNYSAGRSYPLCVYHHGTGEDYTAPFADSLKADMVTNIVESGWIVAASTASGANWGNSNSLTDYRQLCEYALTNYPLNKRFVMFSQSMGGCSGLLTCGNRTGVFTNIVGWFGIYPVCSLSNMYAGSFQSQIVSAYSITTNNPYTTATVGHDPLLLAATNYAGLRMRFYASYSDTTVSQLANTDPFRALVSSVTLENGLQECTGNHGDPSHFQTADVLAFLGRCNPLPSHMLFLKR